MKPEDVWKDRNTQGIWVNPLSAGDLVCFREFSRPLIGIFSEVNMNSHNKVLYFAGDCIYVNSDQVALVINTLESDERIPIVCLAYDAGVWYAPANAVKRI